jgi:4-diphosphocytidyl-2-C-methyl-D-erythritol kinase
MLTLKAPAKINLFLKVSGLRSDGYHEIRSLIQKITLYDELSFSRSDDIDLTTDSDIPFEENLVYRAALLLKNTYSVKTGAEIKLNKNIPLGAGLGGGSSDAAAALLGLRELWSLDCSREELCGIAGQLGSDVPFFLHGALSYAYGRGEKVRQERIRKSFPVLLVKPDIFVSTEWAYKNFTVNGTESGGGAIRPNAELTKKAGKVNNIEHFIRLFEKEEFNSLSDTVLNDLESVTAKEFPVINEMKDTLRKEGAVFTLMSGSGPTVFGIFKTRERAGKASESFSSYWTAIAETIID